MHLFAARTHTGVLLALVQTLLICVFYFKASVFNTFNIIKNLALYSEYEALILFVSFFCQLLLHLIVHFLAQLPKRSIFLRKFQCILLILDFKIVFQAYYKKVMSLLCKETTFENSNLQGSHVKETDNDNCKKATCLPFLNRRQRLFIRALPAFFTFVLVFLLNRINCY